METKKTMNVQKMEVLVLLREAFEADIPTKVDAEAFNLLHQQLQEICEIHGKENPEVGDIDLAIQRLKVDNNTLESSRLAGKTAKGLGQVLNFVGFNGHKLIEKGEESTDVGRAIALARQTKQALKAKAALKKLRREHGLQTIVESDLDKKAREMGFAKSFNDESMTRQRKVSVFEALRKEYITAERKAGLKDKPKNDTDKKDNENDITRMFKL